MKLKSHAPLVVVLFVLTCSEIFGQQPIRLRVDATEAPRRLYHAELVIPATPGPMDLFYPKWIPGEHAPSGPITDLAGLKISAGGRSIEWKRDSVEMFAFHVTVPQGVTSLDVKLDFLSNSDAATMSSGATATSELAILNWNQVLLYPRGKPADDVQVAAELHLPADWKFGTALPVAKTNAGDVQFKTVPLTTLIDSPVLAGRHFRRIELDPGLMPAHVVEIAADSDEALRAPESLIESYRRLVKEARALFGGTHYREYHFLLVLSDQIAHFGLEHHESGENRTRENYLIDEDSRTFGATLISHEYVHSWNGKYRRPDGLATRDYEQPMRGDLLWVYEGLTEYIAWILAARSGARTADSNRQFLALDAAALDNSTGRQWRPLSDTAGAAQLLFEARGDWESMRRGVDFYDEGMLIWLDVDTTIRNQTNGRKSLDDFCKSFFGGVSGAAEVKPYTLDSLIQALNAVVPYDWKTFFDVRVNRVAPRAPLGGIEAAGYRLIYTETPSDAQQITERVHQNINVAYSIGLVLGPEGTIVDVALDKPAGKAGIGPGMKVIGVNDRKFTSEFLHDAIREAKISGTLTLLVANGRSSAAYKLNYRDGEKYPLLEPNGRPSLFDQIFKPRADSR